MLEVGRVVRPHGLKGEVVVDLITDRTERLDPGSVLTWREGRLVVLASRPHQGRWIVTFAGVSDRAQAEHVRGAVLSAPAIDDPEALWVDDLIGKAVVDRAGRSLGEVVEVEANPASDLLVLEDGGLVPLHFLISNEPRRLVVDVPSGLLD